MKFTFENALFEPDTLLFWTLFLEEWQLVVERGDGSDPVKGHADGILQFLHSDEIEPIRDALACAVARTAPLNHEFRIVAPDGQLHWIYLAGRLSSDTPAKLTGVARNITTKKRAEQRIREQDAQLQAVIEQGHMGIYIKDLAGHFLLANQVIQQLAAPRGELHAHQHEAEILSAEERETIHLIDQQVISTGEGRTFEWDFRRDGQRLSVLMNVAPYWKEGQVAGVVGFVHDITQRKRQEEALAELTLNLEVKVAERTLELQRVNEQLLHATMHDALTGLPNRTRLTSRLQLLLDQQKTAVDGVFALLFIDLDKFKSVNDNLGHAAGDDLLLQVGERLKKLQHSRAAGGMVARLGGDEFVLLLEELSDSAAAFDFADQVQQLFRKPFSVLGHDLLMRASIGITLGEYDEDSSADAFLQQADIAMYRAKTRQASRYEVFAPEMRRRRQMLVGLQQDIKHALRRGELFVEYQPLVDLPSGLFAGFEALVRWQHPVHGSISPGEFISIAEDAGVVHEIDLWVLQMACRATSRAIRAGQLQKLSVNLSTQNFQHPELVDIIKQILHEEDFPRQALIIEVTETILVQDFGVVSQMLWALREMDVLIAADDFGTGYSSLSYLHRLPFTNVKLDRSFVTSLEHSPAILRSVLELAGRLNMKVVVEGVETSHQMTVLSELGCSLAQGYYFGRPMSEMEMQDCVQAGVQMLRPVASLEPGTIRTPS